VRDNSVRKAIETECVSPDLQAIFKLAHSSAHFRITANIVSYVRRTITIANTIGVVIIK